MRKREKKVSRIESTMKERNSSIRKKKKTGTKKKTDVKKALDGFDGDG